MHLKAYRPLLDCHTAYNKLRLSSGSSEWRIYWTASLSLLRSVGHVLHKVDSKTSPRHKDIIAKWWTANKANKNSIFHDFIDCERNAILKEYTFAPTHEVHELSYDFGDEVIRLVDDQGNTKTLESLTMPWPTEKYPEARADAASLIWEAYKWWHQQLFNIQEAIMASGRGLDRDILTSQFPPSTAL